MSDLDVYQPANGQLDQAHLAMTPAQAMALDEQVRRCTEAVLREGTDYGVIPGTNGEKTLWRPGAQKLLQWFRLGYTCERTEIERDDQGRKHGITYRAEVKRRHPDGSYETLATCEGTADYDESKFYQDAETVKARLREQEHRWAARDRRAPNADRWNSAKEYRADWNALMKRAQKRAIVGAVVDATAAGGIFTDREEDDSSPSATSEPDGGAWYVQAIEEAYGFTELEAGRELYVEAQTAYREGACSRRQMDHVQNVIRKRAEKLKAATVVEAEDLAAEAEHAQDAAEDTQDEEPPGPTSPPDATSGTPATGKSAQPATRTSSDPEPGTLPVEDPPDWPEVTRPGTGKPKGK